MKTIKIAAAFVLIIGGVGFWILFNPTFDYQHKVNRQSIADYWSIHIPGHHYSVGTFSCPVGYDFERAPNYSYQAHGFVLMLSDLKP